MHVEVAREKDQRVECAEHQDTHEAAEASVGDRVPELGVVDISNALEEVLCFQVLRCVTLNDSDVAERLLCNITGLGLRVRHFFLDFLDDPTVKWPNHHKRNQYSKSEACHAPVLNEYNDDDTKAVDS